METRSCSFGEASPSYVERAKREELASVQVLPSGFTTMSSLHIHLENTHKVLLTYKCVVFHRSNEKTLHQEGEEGGIRNKIILHDNDSFKLKYVPFRRL